MNGNLLFAIGTLLVWVGWFAAIRAVYLLIRLSFERNTSETPHFRSVLLNGVGAVVCILVAQAVLPRDGSGIRLPLVWFVMPWTAWLSVFCGFFVILRGVQSWLAITSPERLRLLGSAGAWLGGLVLLQVLYRMDPANKIEILKGWIPLSWTTFVLLSAVAVATMAAMTLTGRAAKSRGVAKSIVTQLTLISGALVFGLPFAYLMVTSFKEDRDMSSPNGIVWVPRVQQTVPYMDPRRPLYEGEYEGQRVEGTIIANDGQGKVRLDIARPLAIRGVTFDTELTALKEIPRQVPLVNVNIDGQKSRAMVIEDLEDGRKRVQVLEPAALKGRQEVFPPAEVEPIREIGLRWQNYTEAISFLPPETNRGLVYLKNTLLIVVFSVLGTILSSSLVAYAFSRMKFPGRNVLFAILLSTMMLPAAVTLLPQFLIFRSLGWIDTLYPLWVPAFFGSAFNIFLLRQFFMQIPMELEDAAKIDGCTYIKTFWNIMLPQIKPALAVIAIWTFMGAWNNFMGPLIYVNSPENMPLSYALQLFQGDRVGEPGLLMAFVTMSIIPVLALFFFAQRYFIEGVTLSGLGGR